MQLDTTLSLDIIVAVLGIAAVFWGLRRELDTRLSSLRQELKADINDLRREQKADNDSLRQELKSEVAGLRQELKGDIAELRQEQKGDITELRQDIKAVDAKVDVSNQRLARLEGVILSREGLLETILEPDPAE